MDCPDPNCRVGFIKCIGKKVSWIHLGAILAVLIGIFATGMYRSLDIWAGEIEKVTINQEVIKAMKGHIKEVKDAQKDIEYETWQT